MSKVILMGVGEQGIKAVKATKIKASIPISRFDNEMCEVQKIYIDKRVVPDGSGSVVSFPFEYEMSAWVPEIPIRDILKDRSNSDQMTALVEGADLLIMITGIGGAQSLVAKELLRFYRKVRPNLKLYLIGTVPFMQETHAAATDITKRVLAYITQERIACTIISNDEIYRWYRAKYGVPNRAEQFVTYEKVCASIYQEARRKSASFLSRVAEGVLRMLSPQFGMKGLCSHLQDLVYYAEYTLLAEENQLVIREDDTPKLPYSYKKGNGVVEAALPVRLKEQSLGLLKLMDEKLHEQFTKDVFCVYREEVQNPSGGVRIKLLAAGNGHADQLYDRGIHVFPVKRREE